MIEEKFVLGYNNYLKSRYLYLSNEGVNQPPMILISKRRVLKTDSKFIVHSILSNYKLPDVELFPEFSLYEEVFQNNFNQEWFAFAEYVGRDLIYTINIKTGKVFLVDRLTNFIQFQCSKSERGFILAMIEVLKMQEERFKNLLSIDKMELNNTYNKCLSYSEIEDNIFFKIILGI